LVGGGRVGREGLEEEEEEERKRRRRRRRKVAYPEKRSLSSDSIRTFW
jgi:hypothetical protein